jgi:dethiobiotin synthetase
MKQIVIAGIHTEVGKTVVATLFTQALNASYWKPVQCGVPSDQEWVQSVTGQHCYPSTFFLKTPSSPHLAARKEGIRIESRDLQLPEHNDLLIIEGTGGILAPLNETETWIDAALQWQAGWVLVHRHYLGSLNHFFLTIEALKQRGVPLLGVVFNGEGDAATEEILIQKAGSRCLGRLVWEQQLTKSRLQEIADTWKPTLQSILGA